MVLSDFDCRDFTFPTHLPQAAQVRSSPPPEAAERSAGHRMLGTCWRCRVPYYRRLSGVPDSRIFCRHCLSRSCNP